MISNQKKALIHVAKNELGLDDDLYREIMKQEAGVTSSSRLTDVTFEKVMSRFKKMGFKIKRERKKHQRRDERKPDAVITVETTELIKMLYEELGWDQKRRIGFNRRQTGKPWPQTRAEGNKVVEGLKAIIKRNNRKEGGSIESNR